MVHPRLWIPALRVALATAGPGWWRRRPFLPLPDETWWAFRMETAYGDANTRLDAADLVEFIAWSRQERARAARFHSSRRSAR